MTPRFWQASSPLHPNPKSWFQTCLTRWQTRQFCRLGLLLLLLTPFAGVSFFFYTWEEKKALALLELETQHHLNHAAAQMRHKFQFVQSDLQVLASQSQLSSLFQSPHPIDKQNSLRQALEQDFQVFLAHKSFYQQISIWDRQGQVLLTVEEQETDPNIVTTQSWKTSKNCLENCDLEQLQNVGHQPGNVAVVPLKLGQTFLAQLPTHFRSQKTARNTQAIIPIGITILDEQSQRQGSLLLHYQVEQLWAQLQDYTDIEDELILLNEVGDVLTYKTSTSTAMVTNTLFRDQFPTAWRTIQPQESGQFYTDQGLFTFVTVDILQMVENDGLNRYFQPVTNSDTAWKIVLFVPQSELQLQARSRQQGLIFSLFASVAIAGGLTVWLSRLQKKRQTENRRIQETNAFFKSVLDALAEPLYVIDVKTYEVVIANRAARQLGNPEPYTCYALTHRRDRPCAGQNDPCPLQIIQTTNGPVIVEHTHFDAEGKPQIVEVHGYPICDENNQPRYLVEYSLDITARRQAETEIRKLSQAVEQSANTIIITDAKGRIEYANPKCTKTTGYRLDELLGQTPRLFNSGKQSKEYYQQLWTTIRSGKEWRGEFCNRRKDGALYWEQASIAPLLDDNGEITHFIAVKEDITARKKAEEELQISQEQLHQKAQDLSLTLQELRRTQAQLIHTEKMSSLMQLVAGIAHEINNPLNFITNNLSYLEIYAQDMIRLIQLYQQLYPHPPTAIVEELEAIEFDYLCEDLGKLTTSMKSGVERITAIILSLRTFSRMDESDLKRVDLHDGLESTLTFLDRLLTHSKTGERIEIVRDYDILPQVECYAGQLNQVFMNILRNAIEALHSDESAADQLGTKVINIQTRFLDENEDYVCIKIADNGPGIAPEILPQVFDPFFTTKPVGQGSGLGLAVSYQIVKEQHCGQLDCYSTLGAGATFVVTIPISQATSSCLLSQGARS